MKRFVCISLLTLLIPIVGMSQGQSTFIDDVYFKPSDAKLAPAKTTVNQQSATKNGAKEIVYIERNKPDSVLHDTVYLIGQANDSTENQAGYVNGFNGSESDLEYAERIRRFHDPKYTVFISDPSYNDIYFLNNNDWNVYQDGPYAYVTPTWTNSNYWNYRYNSYGYGNWGYPSWGYGWNNPWGYNNYYGYGGYGYGYGFGYGYGYNCFDNYSGYNYGNGYYGNNYWGGGSWGGITYRKADPSHNEGNRREYQNDSRSALGSRLATTTATGSLRTSEIAAGYSGRSSGSSYTVVRDGNNNRGSSPSLEGYSRGIRSVSPTATIRSYQTDNREGVARNTGTRTSSYDYRSGSSATSPRMTTSSPIDTRPRTATNYGNSSTSAYTTTPRGTTSIAPSMKNRTSYSATSSPSTGRTTTYSVGAPNRGSYSSSSSSNATYTAPRSTYNNSNSSSTPTYTAPPPTYNNSSSSSSSSGSSSSGGSSSGGSSSGGGSRSGGSSSGGRR